MFTIDQHKITRGKAVYKIQNVKRKCTICPRAASAKYDISVLAFLFQRDCSLFHSCFVSKFSSRATLDSISFEFWNRDIDE